MDIFQLLGEIIFLTYLPASVCQSAKWPRPTNLVLFAPLNEQSAVNDISPHKRKGILHDKAIFTPWYGVAGGCKTSLSVTEFARPPLGGNDGVASFNDLPAPGENGSFVHSFVYYTEERVNDEAGIYRFAINGMDWISVSHLPLPGKQHRLRIVVGDVTFEQQISSSHTWHFFALSYDAERNKTFKIFANHGKQDAIMESQEFSFINVATNSASSSLMIGQGRDENWNLIGMRTSSAISCFMIYDVALDEKEIIQLIKSCNDQGLIITPIKLAFNSNFIFLNGTETAHYDYFNFYSPANAQFKEVEMLLRQEFQKTFASVGLAIADFSCPTISYFTSSSGSDGYSANVATISNQKFMCLASANAMFVFFQNALQLMIRRGSKNGKIKITNIFAVGTTAAGPWNDAFGVYSAWALNNNNGLDDVSFWRHKSDSWIENYGAFLNETGPFGVENSAFRINPGNFREDEFLNVKADLTPNGNPNKEDIDVMSLSFFVKPGTNSQSGIFEFLPGGLQMRQYNATMLEIAANSETPESFLIRMGPVLDGGWSYIGMLFTPDDPKQRDRAWLRVVNDYGLILRIPHGITNETLNILSGAKDGLRFGYASRWKNRISTVDPLSTGSESAALSCITFARTTLLDELDVRRLADSCRILHRVKLCGQVSDDTKFPAIPITTTTEPLPATRAQFPFVVILTFENGKQCIASVIDDFTYLTREKCMPVGFSSFEIDGVYVTEFKMQSFYSSYDSIAVIRLIADKKMNAIQNNACMYYEADMTGDFVLAWSNPAYVYGVNSTDEIAYVSGTILDRPDCLLSFPNFSFSNYYGTHFCFQSPALQGRCDVADGAVLFLERPFDSFTGIGPRLHQMGIYLNKCNATDGILLFTNPYYKYGPFKLIAGWAGCSQNPEMSSPCPFIYKTPEFDLAPLRNVTDDETSTSSQNVTTAVGESGVDESETDIGDTSAFIGKILLVATSINPVGACYRPGAPVLHLMFLATHSVMGANNPNMIIVATSSGLFLGVVALVIFWRWRKLRESTRRAKSQANAENMYVEPVCSQSLPEWLIENGMDKLSSIFLESGELVIESTSSGQHNESRFSYIDFAKVNKTGADVVLKRWKQTMNFTDLHPLLAEASVMLDISSPGHQNVISLFAITAVEAQICLVFEMMPNGNLHDFLRKFGNQMTTEQHVAYCLQVCQGMVYLTDCNCLHRDLACRNVLVSKDSALVKIADFGHATAKSSANRKVDPEISKKPLPVRWHPPESIQQGIFTSKSDVWSFGVLAWEVFTDCAKLPYEGLENMEVVVAVCSEGLRLAKPTCLKGSDNFIFEDIISACWLEDPQKRLSFQELELKLESAKSDSTSL